MVLALLAGVTLGLRFRLGLVLMATAAVLALGVGLDLGADGEAGTALAGAALAAIITQVVALLVHVLKYVVESRAGAGA